jgi:hypothetical protein
MPYMVAHVFPVFILTFNSGFRPIHRVGYGFNCLLNHFIYQAAIVIAYFNIAELKRVYTRLGKARKGQKEQ